MKNIEFKARCADLGALREKLSSHQVSIARRMRQVDTYFRVASGRLKLREITTQGGEDTRGAPGVEAELIYYRREDSAAARQSEYVLSRIVEPASLTEALRSALGIRVIVDKVRELYLWRHTRVHLDEVQKLGTFLELETVVGGQTLDQAEAECEEIRGALGIEERDMLSGSYSDLLERSYPTPM